MYSVVAHRSKAQIEQDLARLAPDVTVDASYMLEDGYELILVGPLVQLLTIEDFWEHVADGYEQLQFFFDHSSMDQDLPF
jgi:hypothetical protein